MRTRSSKSAPINPDPQTHPIRVKSEPLSSEDNNLETRKRPSTSFQTEKDEDQRKGNRPRLSSPSSKLQSQLDRLETKVKGLSDSVQECIEKSEEFDSARGLIEQKLCEDEERRSQLSIQNIQREVRKEVTSRVKSVNDQLAILKRRWDEGADLSTQVQELKEQVHRLEHQSSQERVPPELSTRQMGELRQYIKEQMMRPKKDESPPKNAIAPASEKVYIDEGKAAEIRGALQNFQETFDQMLEHMLVSKEGEDVNK